MSSAYLAGVPPLDDCVEVMPGSGLQWLRAGSPRQYVDALDVPERIEGTVFDHSHGVRWVRTPENGEERQYFAVIDTHHRALAKGGTLLWLRPRCMRARILSWVAAVSGALLLGGWIAAGVLLSLGWLLVLGGAAAIVVATAALVRYLARFLALHLHIAVRIASSEDRSEAALVCLDPGHHSNNHMITVAGHERQSGPLVWTWTEGRSIYRRARKDGAPFRSSLYWSDRQDDCGLRRLQGPGLLAEKFVPATADEPHASLFCFVTPQEIDAFAQTAHARAGEFRYSPKSSAYVVGGERELQRIEDGWVIRMFKAMLQGAVQSANRPRRVRDIQLGERPFVRVHRITFSYPAIVSMELRTRYRNALCQAMASLGVQHPADLIATTMSEASAVACSLLVRWIAAADESRSAAILSQLLPAPSARQGDYSGRIVIADLGAGTLDIAVTDATYSRGERGPRRLLLRTLHATTHPAAGDRLTAVFAAAGQVDPSNRLRSWVSAEVDAKHRVLQLLGSQSDNGFEHLLGLSELIDSDKSYVDNGFEAGLELLAEVVKGYSPNLVVFSGKSGQIACLYRYALATLYRLRVPDDVAILRASDLVRLLEGADSLDPDLELLLGKRMVAEGLARALGGFGGIDVVADPNAQQLPKYMGKLDPVEGRYRLREPLRDVGGGGTAARYHLEIDGEVVFGYRLTEDPMALAVPICTVNVNPTGTRKTVEIEVQTLDAVRLVRLVKDPRDDTETIVRVSRCLRMPQDFQAFTRGDRSGVGTPTVRHAIELINRIERQPKGNVA
jgi:hypothetical protein